MLNRVELIGRPGADPVVKTLESGLEYGTMNLATSESYFDKEKNERVQITDWHQVVAWRHLAKSLSYIRKGKLIMVIGRLKTRKYTDKQGAERYITEVFADEIHFLERMDDKTSTAKESDFDKTDRRGNLEME